MRGYLPYPPVREVGSVTPSFSHNPLPATDYTLGPGSMLIIDHAGHGCDWGPAAYNVAYESGYPEDQVPALLRQSLLEYVSAMWDKRDWQSAASRKRAVHVAPFQIWIIEGVLLAHTANAFWTIRRV